jgi:hypothetical protein
MSDLLKIVKREEVASWRTSRDTLMHIVADGEWSVKDMKALRDYLDLALTLRCFDPIEPTILESDNE